ncbi:MAG: DUF4956 domain-containing protein, partial [Blastocatellia bacterium]
MNIDSERDENQEDPLALKDLPADEGKERRNEVRAAAQKAVRHASSLGPPSLKSRLSGLANKQVLAIALLLGGVIIASIIAYILLGRSGSPSSQPVRPAAPGPSTVNQPAPAPESGGGTGISDLLGIQTAQEHENEPWMVSAARITLKLALAALLATLLAFRPRRESPMTLRNPYVAQTQILLAVASAALMMIVADNAARAFGIFAAASLVRFRTNIRDPKEITVLLISLAIGLASGVGKVDVAIILSLFSLLVLSLLERYEPEQIFRAMELTVATRKVDETDEVLREMFEKRSMSSELR